MTAGSGVLTVGLHRYELGPDDITFLHPDEIMSWQATSDFIDGHFCLIHPRYFENGSEHVLNMLRRYPFLKASRAVIHLDSQQSTNILNYFIAIHLEDKSANEDKKEAIILHLQMLLLEAQRAGKALAQTDPPETYGYIYGFISLLESSFQLQGKDSSIKIKTAAEFADQLNVHPNYLNMLVKEHTGKTLREHIQERLLYEAKTLLLQTDWDISSISYGLGFSGHAAFTSFFKKKAQVSPSVFRKGGLGENKI
jgi:AraC-like DNA-binding protein